ncbi:MAG: murein biosynthesis integral membrane protein MurJ [Candidatus Omnitrophica bacterium]|nr:murein biosynthesis integral membrane protein MurJ [Candidatus Omnitrophota bacterium]
MDSVNRKIASSSKRGLIQAAGLMGGMTLSSRILGMIRDIFSAKSFGTTWQWDSFIYAFLLPNFFRRLIGEGALSSAFIPVYSEIHHRDGQAEAFRYANGVITVVSSILLAVLLAVEIFLNVILRNVVVPERLTLTLDLLRFLFPYLWFMSLYALGMGILHCHRHFFTPAWGPIILDVVWIAGLVWIVPHVGSDLGVQLRWLSLVILISGLFQFAVEIPPLVQRGFRFSLVWDWGHSGLVKSFRLFLPSVLSFAVIQINILVDMTLGFIIGPGANSSLWYGTRLMQFPLGVFAIAMGTALLPMMSDQTARQELDKAQKTLSFALRSVFLIILPSSVGLAVLRVPIIQLLFERGEFDAVSTARTAMVLLAYTIGLFGFSGQKILAAGFYALQDPRTPVKIGILAVLVNFILNILLMGPMREAGLALATSASGILQFLILMFLYRRKVSSFSISDLLRSFSKILFASVLMGFFGVACFEFLKCYVPGNHTRELLVQVMGSIVLSAGVYIVFCLVLRVREMQEAFRWLLKRPVDATVSDEG